MFHNSSGRSTRWVVAGVLALFAGTAWFAVSPRPVVGQDEKAPAGKEKGQPKAPPPAGGGEEEETGGKKPPVKPPPETGDSPPSAPPRAPMGPAGGNPAPPPGGPAGPGPLGGPAAGGPGPLGGPAAGGPGPLGGPAAGGPGPLGGPAAGGPGPLGGTPGGPAGSPPPGGPAGTPPESTEPTAADPTVNIYMARLDDLMRASTAARNPGLKGWFLTLSVAYDRLTASSGKIYRVTPLPLLWGKDRFPVEFGIAPLDDGNNPGDAVTMSIKQIQQVVPFEEIAIKEVDKLLEPPKPGTALPDDATKADKLAAAERAMVAVLFFHDTAREQNKRRGKNWDPIKVKVYDKLTEVRILRAKQAGIDKDWIKLKEVTGRFAEIYRGNPKVLEQVYAAKLYEADVLVKSDKVTDLERGREILNDYEARFPKTDNETASRIRTELASRAKRFMADAQRLFNQDKAQARNILKSIEAIDPDNDSLRGMQQQMKTGWPVLVIGARRMPERMSPATARLDSEQQAVELMFEGLLDALPDDLTGVRFRPALASERPTVGAGLRDVQLVRSADWAGSKQTGLFDAADVDGTVRLFAKKPTSWAAAPIAWFAEPGYESGDPGKIRLKFKTGHPDPRSLLTFKLHPARWLLEKNKAIDDEEFARRPIGTGPFILDPAYKPANPGDPPKDVVFQTNTAFGKRPGRMGQPFIKEVRITDLNQYPDPVAELKADRIHLITDVPTADLAKYTTNNNLNGRVRVVTAATNRRIWTLAINHRRPSLQNPDVRRGLLHAIDRERILTEIFRDGKTEAHKALTGPFPIGTWATPRPLGGAAPNLYNRDLAQTKFKSYLASPEAVTTLTLAFPADDSQAKSACEKMKTMIEAATATEDRKLAIGLEPLPYRELIRRVEDEQRYDLAYLPFDYKDDWYPEALGSFLDPLAATPGGRNYLGYLGKDTTPAAEDERLGRLLAEVRLYREPSKLDQMAFEVHRRFNDAVPFVPLWQLDRHMVISTAVKIGFDGDPEEGSPRLLNPTTLFLSVGRWKVE